MAALNQSGVISLSKAINKYFELCLYLLVLMGFGTLASTGGLDLPTVIVVGGVLALRGYLLAKRRSVVISERWTTPLSLAYFAFYLADYFLVSRSFLTATVHLVLFGVVVRTFSLRRERDYAMLAILAFLMVLASAVLTVDSVFLFCFAGFMLIAVATFVLMEMRLSGHSAKFLARHSRDPQEHRHLAFSLARVLPALMLMILLGAGAVFFILPRMSAGYLGAYAFGNDMSTGFSDHVQLGQIGQIQLSTIVVMHIQIDGDEQGLYTQQHWRGVSLAYFDGKSWTNFLPQHTLRGEGDGNFVVPPLAQGGAAPAYAEQTYSLAKSRGLSSLIHYRVLMEPVGTNVFFLAPWARTINGAYRTLAVDAGGAAYDIDSQRAIARYEAESDVSTPQPSQLRAVGHEYPGQLAKTYLQLPPLDSRIAQLAAQITASSGNNYDKAAALERYLRTHYGYTLQLSPSTPRDPLANFLFERKEGHCEYFSSAMAVMLRTLGIPSRVVTGFRGAEFNDVTGNYVVRAKNAHAWVEAYFPGYGWQTFDPTPQGSVEPPQGWGRAMLYLDAAASFWREWVIDYDSSHQYVLGHAAMSESRNAVDQVRMWGRAQYEGMVNWARRSQEQALHSRGQWLAVGFPVALLLLFLANARAIVRKVRERWLRTHPERSPDQAATMWYQRMIRALARQGLRRVQSQTPQEFLNHITNEPLRTQVKLFTEVYESARFGRSAEDAQKLEELYEEVESTARK
jgi:transglutaminase-like putative cysteine protease